MHRGLCTMDELKAAIDQLSETIVEPLTVQKCPVCNLAATKRCSRCRSIWYCGSAHQKQHWESHHRANCVSATPSSETKIATEEPQGPRISRVQVESAARRNWDCLVRGYLHFAQKYPDRPIILVISELKTIDDSWDDAKIDCIDPAKLSVAETDRQINLMRRALQEVGSKDDMFGFGLCVGSSPLNIYLVDFRKLLPEYFQPVVVLDNAKIIRENELETVMANVESSELFVRWSHAVSEPSSVFFGLPEEYFEFKFYSEHYGAEVQRLARATNFYVDQICAITQDPGELTGCLMMSEEKNTPVCIAFAFFRLTSHMPIGNHATCLIDLKYIVVDANARRKNLGGTMLEWIRVQAETKNPGSNILIEVESKPTESAIQFWFRRNQFEKFQAENGLVPGSRTYPPMPLLHSLGVINVQETDDEQEEFWNFL